MKGLAVACAALFGGCSQAAVLAISSQDLGSVALNSSTTLTFQISGLPATPSFAPRYGTEFSLLQMPCTGGSPVTCTLQVQFKPKYPGLRQDAIQLLGSDGSLVALTLLHGIGLGPQALLRPGVITTFAGTEAYGNSGDLGSAAAANLSNPQGLAIDNAGNIYIADSSAQVVRKVDTTGTITTYAGNPNVFTLGDGGPATSAGLNTPIGLALDGDGNLYIADSQNNRVRKVDSQTHIITTVAGGGTASVTLGDGGPATAGRLYNPSDVAVDTKGNLYIADQYNNRIRLVDAVSGLISTVAGGGTAAGIDGLGDGVSATAAALLAPSGIALDASGNLYIADQGNNLIRKVSNGIISAVAGTAAQEPLNEPSGVRLDAAGNIYIADTNNSVIWEVNGAGTMFVLAGQSGQFGFNGDNIPATNAQLFMPAGIVIDPKGNLYIADQGNCSVRKIAPGPTALAFNSTNIGNTSSPQTVSLDNIGNQPFSFSAFAITRSFIQQSTGLTDCSLASAVPAASSCSVAIAFAPQTPGPLSGLFSWQSNSQTVATALPLTGVGTGTANAVPAVNITTLSFASQTAGTSSAAQIVTLTNSSADPLSTPAFSINGSNATDFSATTTCKTALAPNASCTVSVTFTPAAAGSRSGTLALMETDATTSAQLAQTVFLQGMAIEPSLTFTPSVQFGAQIVGTASTPQAVTVTNTSTLSLPLASISLSGPSDFAITTNSCGLTLNANASCQVTLTFTPTTLGQEQATLQFTDQAGNSPQQVTLQGTGAAPPVLQLAGGASPANLGQTVLGGSTSLNLTFSNSGQAAYSITAITIGGVNAPEFTIANRCGPAIASGSSCTVGITFKPASIGIRTASLTIAGSTLEAPLTVGLTGIGLGQITSGEAKSGDIRAAGDYDGDGKTDFAVWRPATGTWYVLPSSRPGSAIAQQWGASTDIPVPGDYDGDGQTDFAVWRPATGTWYVLPSSHPGSVLVQQWGASTDIPVPGDYDGDNKTDFAVWRPATGTWYVLPSNHPGSALAQQWGASTDIPVPGDYDGDNKTDFAVWRPSTGTWYVLPSNHPGSALAQQWGASTDIPVPGGYNGDGKTDFAVWRPSTGTWYARTASSMVAQQWGWPTDIPR